MLTTNMDHYPSAAAAEMGEAWNKTLDLAIDYVRFVFVDVVWLKRSHGTKWSTDLAMF
jgi:hypothetical protein